ncbi:MAG: phosphopantetheine-binding protein [Rubrivivax sp.]|nr:phosphopantetheine-binding protein [Rubrivivax sp.]
MSSLEELQHLIHETYGLDAAALAPNASMRGSGIDSLTLVEFLFAVEDKFGIAIPTESAKVDTLSELAALIDKARASQTA